MDNSSPPRKAPPIGAMPQQQRGIEKRKRLFDAAMREYARHGVERARVDDIVAEAEVGWGTFFHYFPRKEDVLLAAAAEHQWKVEAAMDKALADDGDIATRDVLFIAYEAMAASQYSQRIHVAIIREVLVSPARFERMLEAGRAPLFAKVADLLEVGQQRGEVRTDVTAEMLARILNSAILVIAARVGIPGAVGLPADVGLAGLVRTTFRVVWSGIEAAAEGRPQPDAG